jgi:hypothetical protein
MDPETAQFIGKSVDKLYYLGLAVGGVFAGRLMLDLVKEFKGNSKTNSSRPVSREGGSRRRGIIRSNSSTPDSKKKGRVSFNINEDRKLGRPSPVKVLSHNLKEN